MREISAADAEIIVQVLEDQKNSPEAYPLDARDMRRIRGRKKVRAADREVFVEVPDEEEEIETIGVASPADARQSIKIQALLCSIGAQMGSTCGFRELIDKVCRPSWQTRTERR